jgi:pimeloyl-ACP methyl ester carboxylesterase
VPEDRSDTEGRKVGIQVAVVPAVNPAPDATPLFVLAGGPGDAGTQFFAWLPAVFEDVHATRDIVLLDQRGTGKSNALSLPPMPDTTGLTVDAVDDLLATWARDSLAAIGVDPRLYTSTVAADDVDDVRTALGYDQIDIYGTSYGGTLAQYYLRQYEVNVRAAVLDGATPLDVPVLERMAANSQAALDLLLERCATNEPCQQAFPRIADEWTAVVNRLATPMTLTDPDSGAKATIGLADLGDAVHTYLLTEDTAGRIPLAIHLAYQDRWIEAAQVMGSAPRGGPTLLMADEIFCSEAWARFDPTAVEQQGSGSYALARQVRDAQERTLLCRYLPQGAVPYADAAAVLTDKPVLWITADGDPQDPPANLTGVLGQQPNSAIVIMPAQQHVVGHLGCMPSLIADFLEAGDADGLDTSCVANGPAAPLTFLLAS